MLHSLFGDQETEDSRLKIAMLGAKIKDSMNSKDLVTVVWLKQCGCYQTFPDELVSLIVMYSRRSQRMYVICASRRDFETKHNAIRSIELSQIMQKYEIINQTQTQEKTEFAFHATERKNYGRDLIGTRPCMAYGVDFVSNHTKYSNSDVFIMLYLLFLMLFCLFLFVFVCLFFLFLFVFIFVE